MIAYQFYSRGGLHRLGDRPLPADVEAGAAAGQLGNRG